MTFPVPRSLQRVHREHRVPGRDQRSDPRAAVSLNPDHHLRILSIGAKMAPDQLMQPGHPGHPFGQPSPGQHFASLVHHLHIMVIFSQVIADENPHQFSPSQLRFRPGQQPAGEQSAP